MPARTTDITARPETAVQLRRAASLIANAIADLDTTKETCQCCGLRKSRNFAEDKAEEDLSNVVNKLRRWAHAFDDTVGGKHTPKEDSDEHPDDR
jgi:hypothetical protein